MKPLVSLFSIITVARERELAKVSNFPRSQALKRKAPKSVEKRP